VFGSDVPFHLLQSIGPVEPFARFEHHHPVAVLGERMGDQSASNAGSDDTHVGPLGRRSVDVLTTG
jgi:hypothetical protein